MSYRFPREEHLKSPKHISMLFRQGKSVNAFPLRFQFMLLKDEEVFDPEHKVKIAFTVPKKRFKRAVDRNRIKRQMIEMFRLNRESLQELVNSKDLRINLMIVYQGDRMPLYQKLEKRMKSGIEKLCGKL